MYSALDTSQLAPDGARIAAEALGNCVHCGFCNASCPTYLLLGNELDGPRGRIYLIKQVLEGNECSGKTLSHLDRCLSCRACETTCPSGVAYGQLLEVGRQAVLNKVKRPYRERLLRYLLRRILPYPRRLAAVLSLTPLLGWLWPAAVRERLKDLPELPRTRPDAIVSAPSSRQVLLLAGCAQATVRPDINETTIRVLERLDISARIITGSGCCGAVAQHMDAANEARRFMRQNIDAWWPAVEAGAEAILSTSSACSLMLKDYGRLLADDQDYRDKAERVSGLCRDAAELIAAEDDDTLLKTFGRLDGRQRVAMHLPCTAQHGQRLIPALEKIMRAVGVQLTDVEDSHICCGAAGTYTVLQPELSTQLRRNRLQALQQGSPDTIATANIGCLLHLQNHAGVPVSHWIELLDQG